VKALRHLIGLFVMTLSAAHAHDTRISYLDLSIAANTITGQWELALADVELAVGIDADGDGKITWGEIRSQHQRLNTQLFSQVAFHTGGTACMLTTGEHLVDHHGGASYLVMRFSAQCPAISRLTPLLIDYRFMRQLDPRHRALLRISADKTQIAATISPDAENVLLWRPGENRLATFVTFVDHGAQHLLQGWDHVLFLITLLLPAVLSWRDQRWQPGPPLRSVLLDAARLITAFTFAHSITLALVAMRVATVPTQAIEAAIALSVMAAALNNLRPVWHRWRGTIACAFGLVHGFGFSNALAQMQLTEENRLISLLGFNLGIEVAQLLIAAVVLPAALALRRWFSLYRQLLYVVSVLVGCIGALWLVQRV
jgi:hypothetical protein